MGIGTRKQIRIISVAPIKDSDGLMKPNETVLFSGWAQVTNPSGGRNYFVGQDSLDHTKFFKIRSSQGITVDVHTRLIYAGRMYTVNSIEKDREKNFYWNVRATANDNGSTRGWTPVENNLTTEDGDNLITEDGNALTY